MTNNQRVCVFEREREMGRVHVSEYVLEVYVNVCEYECVCVFVYECVCVNVCVCACVCVRVRERERERDGSSAC